MPTCQYANRRSSAPSPNCPWSKSVAMTQMPQRWWRHTEGGIPSLQRSLPPVQQLKRRARSAHTAALVHTAARVRVPMPSAPPPPSRRSPHRYTAVTFIDDSKMKAIVGSYKNPGRTYQVDMGRLHCECKRPEISGHPCAHISPFSRRFRSGTGAWRLALSFVGWVQGRDLCVCASTGSGNFFTT